MLERVCTSCGFETAPVSASCHADEWFVVCRVIAAKGDCGTSAMSKLLLVDNYDNSIFEQIAAQPMNIGLC